MKLGKRGLSMTQALGALGLFVVLILIVVFSTDILSAVRDDVGGNFGREDGETNASGDVTAGVIFTMDHTPVVTIDTITNVTNNVTLPNGGGGDADAPVPYITYPHNASIWCNASNITEGGALANIMLNITYTTAGEPYNTSTDSLEGITNFSGRFGSLGTVLIVAVLLGALWIILTAVGVL